MGYADMHSPHTYRFYNPITRNIILSRNVRWDAWNIVSPKLSMSSHRVQILHGLLEKSHLTSNEQDVIKSLLMKKVLINKGDKSKSKTMKTKNIAARRKNLIIETLTMKILR
jgi:transcriptional regulator CtsR